MPSSFFQEPENQEPEKLKVGDKEYTQEELNALVGIGSQAKDFADKIGGWDKFTEDYGRRGNKIGEYEKKLNELEAKEKAREEAEKARANGQQLPPELTPEQKDAVRKLIVDTFGGEIMTKQQQEEWYQARRSGEKLVDELLSLESEINGADGRPKFVPQDIAEHMDKTGIKNPMIAYKDKYEKELDDWKAKQLSEAKGQPVYTEQGGQGGTNRQPNPVKITRDNINALVREELSGSQQE